MLAVCYAPRARRKALGANRRGCSKHLLTDEAVPKPAQKPHPPVILGGSARNLFQRVVEWGDGWMPVPATPDEIEKGQASLAELATLARRDLGTIDVNVFGETYNHKDIRRFEDAVADPVIVRLASTKDECALTELERMAAQVLA